MKFKFFVLFLALSACGRSSPGPGPFPLPDLAMAPDLQPAPSLCDLPVGTIDKSTPDKGYWVSDGCTPGCLPPHQFFSICTTNVGVLLFDSTTELQKYGATWETYLHSNPCSSTPWRVWQLELVPTPASPGPWADPSIESDCTPYLKKNTGPLPPDRYYYKTVAEIKQVVQQ